MKDYAITAKKKIGDEEVSSTITVQFPETAAELAAAYGDEVVVSNAIANFKITAQAAQRRYLEAGKTEAEIQELMKDWKPGVSIQRSVDPVAAILSKFGSMDPEAQANLVKELKKRAAGK